MNDANISFKCSISVEPASEAYIPLHPIQTGRGRDGHQVKLNRLPTAVEWKVLVEIGAPPLPVIQSPFYPDSIGPDGMIGVDVNRTVGLGDFSRDVGPGD